LVRSTKVPLSQQTIVRTTEQSQVLHRRRTTERVRPLVMQLQESSARTAPTCLVAISALLSITQRDRAPNLLRNVPSPASLRTFRFSNRRIFGLPIAAQLFTTSGQLFTTAGQLFTTAAQLFTTAGQLFTTAGQERSRARPFAVERCASLR
jgi:hypothetical protein